MTDGRRPPNADDFYEEDEPVSDVQRAWQAGIPQATVSQEASLRALPNATWTEVVPGLQLIQFSGAGAPVTVNPGDVVGLPMPGQWRARTTPLPTLARTTDGQLLPETLRGLPVGTVLRGIGDDELRMAWRVVDADQWVVTGYDDTVASDDLLDAFDVRWEIVAMVPTYDCG